jgi:hypothetical protein
MDYQSTYQKVYDETPWYGEGIEGDHCPGVRLIPYYKDWIIDPVMDLGCGRGHTVIKLKEMGYAATGVDIISLNNGMLCSDITKPITGIDLFNSCICMDVIEHITDEDLVGLFENMKKTKRQAFSIANFGSMHRGVELHINRKPFSEWITILKNHFTIVKDIEIHQRQHLYLTEAL